MSTKNDNIIIKKAKIEIIKNNIQGWVKIKKTLETHCIEEKIIISIAILLAKEMTLDETNIQNMCQIITHVPQINNLKIFSLLSNTENDICNILELINIGCYVKNNQNLNKKINKEKIKKLFILTQVDDEIIELFMQDNIFLYPMGKNLWKHVKNTINMLCLDDFCELNMSNMKKILSIDGGEEHKTKLKELINLISKKTKYVFSIKIKYLEEYEENLLD
ncbi:hypothetical protein AB837_00178 [bacterium AB1]|nr:hypothetical protein AB837_00178 [bacterium AB1]